MVDEQDIDGWIETDGDVEYDTGGVVERDSGLTHYTLICGIGTFILTGIDANLLKGSRLAAEVGTFTLTGIAAGLRKTWILVAEPGDYVLTGMGAALTIAKAAIRRGWKNFGYSFRSMWR